MFVRFIKNTILFKIIFIVALTYQTIFAKCFCNCCDCCRLFCDCCDPNKNTDEDRAITENILKHLKLNGNNLDNIVKEINTIQDNEEKIKKIIECSKDIDWENECCPNTLIRWEKNECACIAYFHLMLNNPYFLKLFLICDKTMRRKDKEKDGEYYYLKKEKEMQFLEGDDLRPLEEYYKGYSNPEVDFQLLPHKEKGSQSFDIFNKIHLCIIFDFKKKEDNYDDIFEKTYDFFIENINFENNNKSKFTQENIKKIFEEQKSKYEDNSTKHVKIDKLLGVKIYQKEYHYYSIVNYNGIWYNKNTLNKKECKEMTVHEILELFNKILGIEKINYKDFDKSNCHFLFSKLYEVQN